MSRQTKHLRDIAAVIAHQGEKLNKSYLETWANKKGVIAIWREMFRQIDQQQNI